MCVRVSHPPTQSPTHLPGGQAPFGAQQSMERISHTRGEVWTPRARVLFFFFFGSRAAGASGEHHGGSGVSRELGGENVTRHLHFVARLLYEGVHYAVRPQDFLPRLISGSFGSLIDVEDRKFPALWFVFARWLSALFCLRFTVLPCLVSIARLMKLNACKRAYLLSLFPGLSPYDEWSLAHCALLN